MKKLKIAMMTVVMLLSLGTVSSLTVNADEITDNNSLAQYDSSELSDLGNQPPQVNLDYGRHYIKNKESDPSQDVYSTNANSSQNNGMHTLFFLPKGFNLDRREHGNYQSIVVTKNNLYLLESLGTGTNQGVIAKISLNDIKRLGLDTPDHINSIAEAFHFYDPMNPNGYKSSPYFNDPDNALSDFSNVINGDKKVANHLVTVLDELKDRNQQSQTSLKYWHHVLDQKNNDVKKLHNNKSKNRNVKAQVKNNLNTDNNIIKHANDEVNTWQKWQGNYSKRTDQVKSNLNNQQQKINLENQQYDKLKIMLPKAKMYKNVISKMKITGLMDIGHGQSLSYNPADNGLYLIQDDKPMTDPYNRVIKMNPDTLNVERTYSFLMPHNGGYYGIHTLTFDNQGNAYVGRSYSYGNNDNKYIIFKGRFGNDSVQFQPEKQLISRGNPINQYLSYDAANNRMYIVSDDILTSVPLDKLNEGTLTPSDVNYTTFDTHREFEGLSFDQAGNGYQLLLWSPEVMKYDNPLD